MFSFCLFVLDFIYLREVWGKGTGGEGAGGAEGEADSPLSRELSASILGPWDHNLIQRQTLNRLTAQAAPPGFFHLIMLRAFSHEVIFRIGLCVSALSYSVGRLLAVCPHVPQLVLSPFPATAGEACIICFHHAANTCLIPCGHTHFCSYCAWRVFRDSAKCPICRWEIKTMVPVRGPPTLRTGEGLLMRMAD